MNKKIHQSMLVSGVLVSLSFLPGCALTDMFKGRNTQSTTESSSPMADSGLPMTGEVLVTMKGIPAITVDSLAIEREKLLKANPQIKQALAVMDPKAFDRNLLEGLIGAKVIDEYVSSHKINQTAAYQAELKDMCKSMEQMLNQKYFSEQKSVVVSDSEVKSFYDANKDKMRGIMISQGGVAATGIEFTDRASAAAFVAKAKATPGGFKKAAQDENLTAKIKDFKLVNSQSIGIDEMLRDKIVAIKSVPSIDLFEVDGTFWVVHATTKEEPKYLPYEQIKDRLKQELEQNKRVELFEKEIATLRNEYAVEVNENYFKNAEMPQQELPQGAVQSGGMANVTDKKDATTKQLA
ncbi:MAG TPA: peptidylprolyl isomerase [Candidatus Babeliales bacterium]|nr:peptidylprolyl isomerase [Candidatus Babeliales bacterium]